VQSIPGDTTQGMQGRLTSVLNHLVQIERQESDGVLGPGTFRNVMKASSGVDFTYLYMPTVRLNLDLGDIGIIRNNRFVRLCNVHSLVQSPVRGRPPFFVSIQDQYRGSEAEGSRVVHTIQSPSYFVMEWNSRSQEYEDTTQVWDVLAHASLPLLAHFGTTYNIKLSDLILVAGVTDNRREATIERKKDEIPLSSEICFIESTEEWDTDNFGRWSVDPDEGYEHWTERCAQYIIFAQLEDGEVDGLESRLSLSALTICE